MCIRDSSQELVDAYGMQATGEMPILGYSDEDHLMPIINTASGYNPEKPYEGRDPRFYASIYYNNSPRTLGGISEKKIYPIYLMPSVRHNIAISLVEEIAALMVTTGADPWIFMTPIGSPLTGATEVLLTFEYKTESTINNAEFFYCVAGGPQGGKSSGENVRIPKASEWTRFEFDLMPAVQRFGFGVNASGGCLLYTSRCV